MREPVERLLDILDAIDRINRYSILGRERFDNDELVQTWCVHHLQLIGEAAARLGRDFHASHPVVEWDQIIGMRNVLVHDYFGIDVNEVWVAVDRDLPRLEDEIRALLVILSDDSKDP